MIAQKRKLAKKKKKQAKGTEQNSKKKLEGKESEEIFGMWQE